MGLVPLYENRARVIHAKVTNALRHHLDSKPRGSCGTTR